MTSKFAKEPTVAEVKSAVDQLGRAFEAFKNANDSADHLRKKGGVDPLLEEKINRINSDMTRMRSTLDGLHLASARPGLQAKAENDPRAREHKAFFYDRFVRKGQEVGLQELESKALSTGVNADGGYAVPDELDRAVDRLLRDVSPIRQIANVVQIGSSNYRKLVSLSDAASGWVGETDARTETASPHFAEVVPALGEIYSNPAATQGMLDDSFFDVEAWLAEELAIEFGVREGAAFISGNGANKPKGFLASTTAATADAARAFGTLQHLVTGVNGAFPVSNPQDILIDLVYSLRPVYRAGATFVMNTNLVAKIRKFKDGQGNYIWQPGLTEGAAATLLGYRVVEATDMPDLSTDSLSVAFGNFQRGYTITDRMGTRVLRDPFSNKPYVHFYTTKRTGGGVVDSNAIKLLKFSA